MRPLLGDIIRVLLAQAHRDPDPIVVSIQLQKSGSPIDLFVHVIPIKSGHVGNFFGHTRLFAALPFVFPILMVGLIGRNDTESIRNRGTPQVTGELVELRVETGISDLGARLPVNKGLYKTLGSLGLTVG